MSLPGLLFLQPGKRHKKKSDAAPKRYPDDSLKTSVVSDSASSPSMCPYNSPASQIDDTYKNRLMSLFPSEFDLKEPKEPKEDEAVAVFIDTKKLSEEQSRTEKAIAELRAAEVSLGKLPKPNKEDVKTSSRLMKAREHQERAAARLEPKAREDAREMFAGILKVKAPKPATAPKADVKPVKLPNLGARPSFFSPREQSQRIPPSKVKNFSRERGAPLFLLAKYDRSLPAITNPGPQ